MDQINHNKGEELMAIYKGIFNSKKDVFQEFSHSYGNIDETMKTEMKNCKILLAWYGHGSYDGSAFVLFERNSKLYEVNGGHCSCYGLEGQWEPEETSVEELRHRVKNGTLGRDGYYSEGVFDKQLLGVLARWEKSHKS